MTLEEKAALCTGASAWTTTPIERLGVPEITVSDGPHGVRRVVDGESMDAKSFPATCFPTASCLASSWDVDLIHTLGQALAEECIALDVDIVLGPGTNMKRTPLGGRNFEYFSEDPYLAGQMASSFINGVQKKGVGTSLKHFAANNQETQRMTISAELDERTLREIYLPAFETAVKNAQPWTVMCAYNKLNGTYCSENYELLVNILKKEWGFEGFVVSDWGAVHDRVASIQGGLDLEMPGPREGRVKAIIEAVQSGNLDETVLDESVHRILSIVQKAIKTPKGIAFNSEKNHALARKIASEGMVLLKNNGVLPLKDYSQIAVIGRSAKQAHFQGGGSSHINPTQVDIPFEELKKLAKNSTLTFDEGYPVDDRFNPDLINQAVKSAQEADVALLYIALPDYKESEGYDRSDLELTQQQIALIKAVGEVQPNTVVILNNGAPVVMSEWLDYTAAVLEAWMMGQAGGGAIADILFGKINPSGKLAETFPIKLSDTPAFLNFPGENGEVRYGEGIFIGYRYFDKKQAPVQFPFGYGLSYTTFKYANLNVSADSFIDKDGLRVTVEVTNTGNKAGSEIVQLYIHDQASELVRPIKELKGFAKVDLQPGETKTVIMELDFRSFAYFHPSYKKWITEDGKYDILVGASSADIRCSHTVTLQSTVKLPSLLNRDSTLKDWLDDPRGREIITPLFQQFMAKVNPQSEENKETEEIDPDIMGYMLEIHLQDLLYFQEKNLPASPEAIITDLLTQIHAAEL
ncbi:MAG: glycosyl hydrolase [Anaerolineaceae bacterium]|nr:glycosyl hydrolase [Anaerolineaceae bacterium]